MSAGNITMSAEVVGKIDDLKRKLAMGERDVRAFAARINSTKAELKVKVAHSGLTGLKKSLGEDSAFGLGVKTLAGAGAIAGVGLLARGLADVTGKAAQLKAEFEAGKKSAGEVADELARSVPVLGQIYTAGRNIRELATGEQAAAAMIRAEAEAMNQLVDARRRSFEAGQQAANAMAKTLIAVRREGALIGANEFQAAVAKEGFSTQDRAEAIREQANREQAKIGAGATVTYDGKPMAAALALSSIDGKIQQLQGELRDAQVAARNAEDAFIMGGGDNGMAAARAAKLETDLAALKMQRSSIGGIAERAERDSSRVAADAQKALAQLGINLGKTAIEAGKSVAERFWAGFKDEAAKRARVAAEAKVELRTVAGARKSREQELRAERANKLRDYLAGQAEPNAETKDAERELKSIQRDLEVRNATRGMVVENAAFSNLSAGVAPDNETAQILKDRIAVLLDKIEKNTGKARPATTS